MTRSRRAPFTNVERASQRGLSALHAQRIAQQRREAARAALDGLVDGHAPDEAQQLYRAVAHALPERLGLTTETATLLASRATDASLASTLKREGGGQ